MIAEALQWIKDQAKQTIINVDGREYSTQGLTPVLEPTPNSLKVHTLTGLMDYLEAQESLDDMQGEHIAFSVLSHAEVRLISEIKGSFRQRDTFITAVLPEANRFPFGQWMEAETFIIELQAKFVEDDNTKALLQFVTSITESDVRTSKDDGVSQEVTARQGITMSNKVKVPNPVILRPYRTFMEVTQPAISCVFRVKSGPMLSLHEADGGRWRLEAIESIKKYLEGALGAMQPPQKVPVIA